VGPLSPSSEGFGQARPFDAPMEACRRRRRFHGEGAGGHRSSATRSGSGGFAAEAYAMWWVRGDSARQRAAACLRLVRHQWRAWAWRQPAALTREVQALRGAMRVKDRGWPRAFDGPLSSPCNECCGLRLWWAAAMAR
jgi:hypothetical protein